MQQLKDIPSKSNLRDDVEELIDIVDALVFSVGITDADVQKLSDPVNKR